MSIAHIAGRDWSGMSDCQEFPNTWEEFEQAYGFEDRKEIYTNGSRLIQSFRVKQWLDHIAEPERKKGEWVYKPNEYDDSTYECSQCGEPWTLIDGTPEENNMKFCPSCGADMRGE